VTPVVQVASRVQDKKRKAIYPFIISAIGALVGIPMELTDKNEAGEDITRTLPAKPFNLTGIDKVYESPLRMAHSVKLFTVLTFDVPVDDAALDLMKLNINYFLQPDDQVSDAEDDLDLAPGSGDALPPAPGGK
jgi:hypothetical protein